MSHTNCYCYDYESEMDRWHDESGSDEAWQAYVAELKEDFETGLETPETLLKEGVDWNETDERARWTEFEERDAEARRAQLTYWAALDAAQAERVALARAEAESQYLALEAMYAEEEADWADKEETLKWQGSHEVLHSEIAVAAAAVAAAAGRSEVNECLDRIFESMQGAITLSKDDEDEFAGRG